MITKNDDIIFQHLWILKEEEINVLYEKELFGQHNLTFQTLVKIRGSYCTDTSRNISKSSLNTEDDDDEVTFVTASNCTSRSDSCSINGVSEHEGEQTIRHRRRSLSALAKDTNVK